jgi:hypothetical protein
MSILGRIVREPPLRLLARALICHLPFSIRTKAAWDAAARPNYLTGLLYAVSQAEEEGARELSVIEFGVAGGAGLVTLQEYAGAVEKATGTRIRVWGVDTGEGLSQLCGDYRDHPDRYARGEYSMDEKLLSQRLNHRTKLILGDVDQTVQTFVRDGSYPPIGFIAIDLDLYSSTRSALQILALPGKRLLRRIPIYFDDVDSSVHHDWAGELMAIKEFNDDSDVVKIDQWRGLEIGRPFPDSGWLKRMYMAHDLAAISSVMPRRSARELPLSV